MGAWGPPALLLSPSKIGNRFLGTFVFTWDIQISLDIVWINGVFSAYLEMELFCHILKSGIAMLHCNWIIIRLFSTEVYIFYCHGAVFHFLPFVEKVEDVLEFIFFFMSLLYLEEKGICILCFPLITVFFFNLTNLLL